MWLPIEQYDIEKHGWAVPVSCTNTYSKWDRAVLDTKKNGWYTFTGMRLKPTYFYTLPAPPKEP